MSSYILGLGGNCCGDCTSDDPCANNPVITSGSTASGVTCLSGTVYTITASNSPTSFGATGLPSGLSVNTGSGVISGRVRATFSGSITVSATNACGTDTKSVTLTITATTVPTPTLACDSISASLTKCGYNTPGFDTIYYLTSTLSGNNREEIWPGAVCGGVSTTVVEYQYSGSCTIDPFTCLGSGDRGGARSDNGSPTSTDTDFYTEIFSYTHVYGLNVNSCASLFSCNVASASSKSVIADAVCYGPFPSFKFTGTATETLSNLYSTSSLISNTVSLLPSYPGTFSGTCSSLRDLSSDEVTYSIRRFKYKFVLPDLTGYDCYKITWKEGTTDKSYIWNGTDTETSVYGPVDEPGSNGTIDINTIAVSCSCS